jgi:type I restriction-modification system DNA methylase subunit
MAIKKSELYTSIWTACDELRGRMDASQYKDYVLVLLFVKYVSDKYADQKNALIDVPKGARYVATMMYSTHRDGFLASSEFNQMRRASRTATCPTGQQSEHS